MMYKITRDYYNRLPNVRTVYYAYSDTITEDFKLEGDILYIKGVETYVPGILKKTVDAFRYFEKDARDYDYIFRSNVSTIINFSHLYLHLDKANIEYGGGVLNNLWWLDPSSGVVDETWFGTTYASGIFIIFSKNTFVKMMEHVDKLRYNLIDDLAIGVLFREHICTIKPTCFAGIYVYFTKDFHGDYSSLAKVICDNTVIAYRNRDSENRDVDIQQMMFIVSQLVLQYT